ncbi:MAG: RteC domain-containing protein [Candidatus Symbiothrix sp.]|jgi:hypothetical protein|nr:RteC domain-containing protein [Candidatus Symbiothrix sp.]
MKRLVKTKFFLLIKKAPETDLCPIAVEKAYDEFADVLFAESASTEDKVVFHNILCFTRVELASLHQQLTDLSKKKFNNCPVLNKAISLVDTQLEFTKWNIQVDKYGQSVVPEPRPKKKLEWTGNIVDLVELGYALFEVESFNKGKITLKDLFHSLGEAFNLEVQVFSRFFTSIKNRTKGERTIFLDKLKKGLIQKMEDADKRKY